MSSITAAQLFSGELCLYWLLDLPLASVLASALDSVRPLSHNDNPTACVLMCVFASIRDMQWSVSHISQGKRKAVESSTMDENEATKQQEPHNKSSKGKTNGPST